MYTALSCNVIISSELIAATAASFSSLFCLPAMAGPTVDNCMPTRKNRPHMVAAMHALAIANKLTSIKRMLIRPELLNTSSA